MWATAHLGTAEGRLETRGGIEELGEEVVSSWAGGSHGWGNTGGDQTPKK